MASRPRKASPLEFAASVVLAIVIGLPIYNYFEGNRRRSLESMCPGPYSLAPGEGLQFTSDGLYGEIKNTGMKGCMDVERIFAGDTLEVFGR